jgi:hypothetical protein
MDLMEKESASGRAFLYQKLPPHLRALGQIRK